MSLRTFHSLWPFSKEAVGWGAPAVRWDDSTKPESQFHSFCGSSRTADLRFSCRTSSERLAAVTAAVECSLHWSSRVLLPTSQTLWARARDACGRDAIRSIAMLSESFGKKANFWTFSTAQRKPSELAAVTLFETDLVGRCVESSLDRSRLRMPRAYRNPESDKGVLLREKGRPLRASRC